MEGISLFSSKKLTSKFKKSLMKALSDSTDDSFCRMHSALMVFMSLATKSTMRFIRLIWRAWLSRHGLWRRGLKASIGLLVLTGYGPSMDTQSLPPGALRSMVVLTRIHVNSYEFISDTAQTLRLVYVSSSLRLLNSWAYSQNAFEPIEVGR